MAEIAVDDRRLLKTMRWWDGFVVGLACPGFLLAGLWGSVAWLGPQWAAVLWFSSALVGTLQAYVYAEPAAMFPDKAGGLSMYAKEGWRKHFTLAGPIATVGYWFAWSSVLAIYGGIIGTLLLTEFTDQDPLEKLFALGFIDVRPDRLIGAACILICFLFNVRGMRPAVWLSYATGAMMVLPLASLAIIPLLNGDITSHALSSDGFLKASVETYGDTGSGFNQVLMLVVWFWVIGWSTYGPEAPATFAPEFVDTKNDTRYAILSTGALNTVLSLILPLTIVGVLGTGTIIADPTFIGFLATALEDTVGSFLGGLFVIFICGGLLLSMNTATMDGSRALYGMAREGLTIKWLARLNKDSVPGRAMTLDVVLNIVLLFAMPSLFFTLAAGNIGYVLAHVFALSGFLLLRRDRPNWPRPLHLGPVWILVAWACLAINLIGTLAGIYKLKYTSYLYKGADPTGYFSLAIIVALIVLTVAILGFIIGQRQAGRGFSLRDERIEEPTQEAYDLAGLKAPA